VYHLSQEWALFYVQAASKITGCWCLFRAGRCYSCEYISFLLYKIHLYNLEKTDHICCLLLTMEIM